MDAVGQPLPLRQQTLEGDANVDPQRVDPGPLAASRRLDRRRHRLGEIPPVGELRHARDISFFQAPLIVGTPDDAIAEIERYTAETRCTQSGLSGGLFGSDVKNIFNF